MNKDRDSVRSAGLFLFIFVLLNYAITVFELKGTPKNMHIDLKNNAFINNQSIPGQRLVFEKKNRCCKQTICVIK
ncbi:hypothetical protein ASD40_11640 [Paenibacillus sp. Root444D2]|nr:hypothetical protein ASD40_11640 [Paenibacillus sp. Root444D2]